jgi:hypothetical protein
MVGIVSMNKLLFCCIAVVLINASNALACTKPEKPSLPDPSAAVTAQMVKAHNDVKLYVKSMQEYLGCAQLPASDEKKELDGLTKYAEDFNKVIKEYKAAHGGS